MDKDSTQRNFPLSELGNVVGKYARNTAERVSLGGLDKNHRHRTIDMEKRNWRISFSARIILLLNGI